MGRPVAYRLDRLHVLAFSICFLLGGHDRGVSLRFGATHSPAGLGRVSRLGRVGCSTGPNQSRVIRRPPAVRVTCRASIAEE